MKYFVSDDHWDLDGYMRHLPSLESRLAKPVYRFFLTNSFHDSRILNIQVINEAAKRASRRDPTIVEIALAHRNGYVYALRYSGVVRLGLEFDGRRSQGCLMSDGTVAYSKDDRHGLYEWGYDELTEHDADYLAHEVLFHSQTRLELHFRRITLKRSTHKHDLWK